MRFTRAFVSYTLAATLFSAGLLAIPSWTGANPDTRPQVAYHWHMHQPIYWNARLRALGPDRYEYAWESIQQRDGGSNQPENDLREIFGKDDRVAAYQSRPKDSIATILSQPNAGASISYSGALMENVQSLGAAGQLGYSSNWPQPWRDGHAWKTGGAGGTLPRMEFTNFSYHHALLALHNPETVYMELRLQQEKVRREFGEQYLSDGIFPTEMCFSIRLIPVLKQLGIEWTIVSGEHIARAMPDFPVQLGSGGINNDLPNRADQVNPPGVNFLRKQISRGNAPVNANPASFQPAYTRYIDPETGEEHRIIAVPADQAWGWEDGYGCLGANFLDDGGANSIEALNDPSRPSLVLLVHDGDNAFGGGYSYYLECVPNMASGLAGRGNQVTTIRQYLADHPPPVDQLIHVPDGGWANADSDFGSPIFVNWNYPPLAANGTVDPENGWHEKMREYGIFTASLNRILTAQQILDHEPDFEKILYPDVSTSAIDRAWHYYLGSLDSGNVYFGAVLDLEIKATIGNNEVARVIDPVLDGILDQDETPPTIWLPQRHPYNPGSLNFGVQYGYQQYYDDGDFHVYTFISDVSGIENAVLRYRIDLDGVNPLDSIQNETFAGGDEVGEWIDIPMTGRVFPKDNIYNKGDLNYYVLPTHIADYYWAEVTDLRDVLIDYYVKATDVHGNVARSPIQHVYIGTGEGSSGGGGNRVTVEPNPVVAGETVTITFDATGGPLAAASPVYIHLGRNGWTNVIIPNPAMTSLGDGLWQFVYEVPESASMLDMVFNDGAGTWDNNGALDWHFLVVGGTERPLIPGRVLVTPTPALSGQPVTIVYDERSGPLSSASSVFLYYGINDWATVYPTTLPLARNEEGYWEVTLETPTEATELNFVFNNGSGTWDNNSSQDWKVAIESDDEEPPPVLMGDVNDDGSITPADAQLAFDCWLLGECPPGANAEAANFCGGESITPSDAQGIFRAALGEPDPCGTL